ncbi:MAG TPA: response regulator [Candidatus Baltobacteraceae bacterium]|nr:response regulator [Candidatus Baltobacteraceae bacterium]
MSARVLIVEDNQPNRELLSDWLEVEGFEVLSAENLEQSFAALQNSEVDAVLLDVQLGADDGLTIATWMRNHAGLRNVPVIAVTAHAMVTDHQRVINAGCNACISKPIDFRALREQLDRWIGQPAYSPPVA